MAITVTLTAYNMGENATEADFDAFAAFVAARIDERVGFEVSVDQSSFRNGPAADEISGASDEQRETIREAIEAMWGDWCAQDQGDPPCPGADGDLMTLDAAQFLRRATPPETDASRAAARRDGGAGVIVVDGVRCYVQESAS